MSREKNNPLDDPMPSKKTWRKKAVIILCVMVLGAGGYYAYRSLTPKDTTYLTMPVTKGKITDVVQATGTVKPLQEADLKFKEDGTLHTLHAKVGQEVVLGQQLAVQDDADLRTAVDQAANEVTQAQYRMRQSELDLETARVAASRQEALYKEGAISQLDFEQSQRDYENAKINLDMAKASIESTQVRLQIAKNTLEDAVLTAPFNGIISSVTGEVGQDSSIVLIHMISPQLQVIAMVNEADINRVKVNQQAYLTLASSSSERVSGVVKQISPQATTVNNIQLYEVAITVDDKDDLLMPGMSVTANIIANQSSSEMALVQNIAFTYAQNFRPATANADGQGARNGQSTRAGADGSTRGRQETSTAGQNNDQAATANRPQAAAAGQAATKRVVVLENGQPVVKTVQTGLSDGQNTEVISGLEPGEQVVIGTNNQTGSTGQTGGQGGGGNTNVRIRGGGPGGPMF